MPDSPSELAAVEPAQPELTQAAAPADAPSPTDAPASSAPSDQPPSVIVTQVAPAEGQAVPTPLPTFDDLCEELRPDQVKALRHLLTGLNITDAAIASGIGCRTLYRWCKEDETFAAALNTWKHAQLDSCRTQALALLSPALKTVGNAIQHGHVSASLQVIRGLGVLSPQKPGETDPDQLKRKRKIRKHRRQERLEQLEQKYRVPDDNPIETVAEWDYRLGDLLELRDHMIDRDERKWRHYERRLHLTDEQLKSKGWERPSGPPSCPRPSEAEIVGMCQRESLRHNWAVDTHTEHYLQIGRYTAEAAQGPIPDGHPAFWMM